MTRSTLRRTAPRSVPRGRGAGSTAGGGRRWQGRGLPLSLVAVAVVVAASTGWILGSPSSFDRQVAALEGESLERDVEQVADLVITVTDLRATILDPLDAMHTALPREEAGPAAEPGEAEGWIATFDDATAPFDDPPSGLTGTNAARNTLRSSIKALHGAASTYRLALDTSDPTRDGLFAQAAAQRDLGIELWDTGIIQLDERSHATGGTHHHGLVLPRTGSAAAAR